MRWGVERSRVRHKKRRAGAPQFSDADARDPNPFVVLRTPTNTRSERRDLGATHEIKHTRDHPSGTGHLRLRQ